MNAASQRWSVLAPSSKSPSEADLYVFFLSPLLNKCCISTRLAWQLASSLQFSALFCLLVVQILLPALFF